MSTVVNKVGLEAEFFLTNKKGEILYPSANGFDCDEFIILGEFRAKPGRTRSETIGNFMTSYYNVVELAKKKGKIINLDGVMEISPEKNAEIMRKMEHKTISQSLNIYDTDILTLSDNIVKNGKVTGRRISTGFHIHFSSSATDEKKFDKDEEHFYRKVNLPLTLTPDIQTNLEFYTRYATAEHTYEIVTASVSRITKPVLKYFIKKMDDELLPMFLNDELKTLKFRNPGFYEEKSHGGFEYRSLPFNWDVLENVFHITDFAFNLLEEL